MENFREIIAEKSTVLLIDDDEIVLDVWNQILQKMGYFVIEAKNGKDAIEIYKVQKSRISLVIIDLAMPVMDGEKTSERLRAINPEIKILLSTGWDLENLEGRTTEKLKYCCDGIIQKPYTMKELSAKLAEILA